MCTCRQKEKRLQDEKLRSTKGLGEADPENDDLMAWVGKSRRIEEERAKAERMAKMLQQQVWSSSDMKIHHIIMVATTAREAA